MNRSENISNIAAALLKAQAEMGAAAKNAQNPHLKNRYADLPAVIDAVKAPLNAHGITFLQGVQDADNGVIVETMLLHTSGEWISSALRLPAPKNDPQGYGSAITYGRRYGLQALLGIPAEDDDGNAASGIKGNGNGNGNGNHKPAPSPVTRTAPAAKTNGFMSWAAQRGETTADAQKILAQADGDVATASKVVLRRESESLGMAEAEIEELATMTVKDWARANDMARSEQDGAQLMGGTSNAAA